ncbi:MAG: FAD-dependent monooxygenase [Planctomycetota bacterium]
MIDAECDRGVAGLAEHDWDAVVIGAGPAGSLTAGLLAERGRSVLLVEKSVFPRWKVCGACLGAAGVGVLERHGLMDDVRQQGARPVEMADLCWRGRRARVALRGMVTISRNAMDAALADRARERGAAVAFGVRADASPGGRVRLSGRDGGCEVRARVVVQAGGLRAARGAGSGVRTGAWMGLGAVSDAGDDHSGGSLMMAVGARGYVGRVVTEGGVANWAAAVDPALVREMGSPAEAAASICARAGVEERPPCDGWFGTPTLTRRAPAVDGAVCRVGDAAGYVEPITGEGMSWALLGAEALAPIVDRSLASGHRPIAWIRVHGRLMRRRRWRCGAVARALRSPITMGSAMVLFGGLEAGRAGERLASGLVGGLIGAGNGRRA